MSSLFIPKNINNFSNNKTNGPFLPLVPVSKSSQLCNLSPYVSKIPVRDTKDNIYINLIK